MVLVRFRRLLKNQKGQSMIEFALVLPILILLVFAVVDFGRYFNTKMTLQAAAREGARAGVISKTPEATAESRTRAYLNINMTGTVTPTITASTPEGTGRGNPLKVTINYGFVAIYAPVFGGKTSIPITVTLIFPQEDV